MTTKKIKREGWEKENKESIDEISQGILIKQKKKRKRKKMQQKISQIVLPETEQQKKSKGRN